MTDTSPPVPPPPEDLTAGVFRALYPEFDLHTLAGAYLAVPAGHALLYRSGPRRDRSPDQRTRAPRPRAARGVATPPPAPAFGTETLMHPPDPFHPPPPGSA